MRSGRRCGPRAADQAHQPPAMAKGASPRSGAAPAGVLRTHISGRPRVTVRPKYVGLPVKAGRGPDEPGRKPGGSGGRRSRSGPGSTVPRPKIAASGAPRGERADRKARTAPRKRGYLVRLPALHSPHFIFEAEKTLRRTRRRKQYGRRSYASPLPACGERSSREARRVRGLSAIPSLADRPPHPNPLPARG